MTSAVMLALHYRDAERLSAVLEVIASLPPPRWDADLWNDPAAEIASLLPAEEARRLERQLDEALVT